MEKAKKMIKFQLTKPQHFLCLCIRHIDHIDTQSIKALYHEFDDNYLFEEAKLNGVASITAHALVKTLGEENVPEHWINEYQTINDRLTTYMAELNKVATLLSQHNIQLLALKNSGITIGMYPHWGACPMGDIDVLVDKCIFRKAHAILEKSGYKLKFRCEFEEDNIEAAEEGGGAEYSVDLDNGEHLWFELQWRPVAGRWIQPKQEPKAKDLVARSIEIPNSHVRLLSPEDNLLQVALHTAKHTFVRAPGFRLHTDVDRIVTTQNIDWDKFVDMVLSLKTKTAVFMSLAMAKSLLGTEVPDKVLTSIKPGNWKIKLMVKWLEKVGIFEPDSPKWNKLGYIIFVSLLYDSFTDFIQGVFPSSEDMKAQYHFKNSALLPYYHIKRLLNLILRRAKT